MLMRIRCSIYLPAYYGSKMLTRKKRKECRDCAATAATKLAKMHVFVAGFADVKVKSVPRVDLLTSVTVVPASFLSV